MKSKPVVRNDLTGNSGTGKAASFSFIKECMALNPDIYA